MTERCVSLWKGARCERAAQHDDEEHEAWLGAQRLSWTDADTARVFAPKPTRLCGACGKARRCPPCGGQGELLAPLQGEPVEEPAVDVVVEASPTAPSSAEASPAPEPGEVQHTAASTVVHQLDEQLQRELVAQVGEVRQRAALVRPHLPSGTAMKVQVTAAGELCWWSDAKGYRYISRHPGGYAFPSIPETWLELWRRFSGRPDLKPDCALVNWYAPREGMGLGWHADRTEQDPTLPVVTISLGDPAQWAVREREGAPVTRCRLETGAVTLLAGATRMLEHTIERLLPPPVLQVGLGIGEQPPPFFEPMPSPLRGRGRISITMRVAGDPRAAASAVAEPAPPPKPAAPYEQARAFLEELERRTGRRTA